MIDLSNFLRGVHQAVRTFYCESITKVSAINEIIKDIISSTSNSDQLYKIAVVTLYSKLRSFPKLDKLAKHYD